MQPFHKIAASFAITQTLLYGALYYSFTKLLPTWVRDTGWTLTEVSAGLTIALLVSAAVAPIIGRQIDKQRGAIVLMVCALLGALCLFLLSGVTALWQFYAVYVVMGVAMSGSLYEACFSILTKTMGKQTRQAITIVTLVAGFASTIAFPTIFWLERAIGWRQTVWMLAGVVAFVAAPLQWYGATLALRYQEKEPTETAAPSSHKARLSIGRNPIFWLLAVVYATIAYNHSGILNHMLPLLEERQLSEETAVLVASFFGPMQVVGRVVMFTLEKRVSSLRIFVTCFVSLLIASAALLATNFSSLFIPLFIIGHGAGYGVTSIMKPLITAEFMGNRNYGMIAGLLAIPTGIAGATAPTIAAVIHSWQGYNAMIIVGFVVTSVGLLCLILASQRVHQ